MCVWIPTMPRPFMARSPLEQNYLCSLCGRDGSCFLSSLLIRGTWIAAWKHMLVELALTLALTVPGCRASRDRSELRRGWELEGRTRKQNVRINKQTMQDVCSQQKRFERKHKRLVITDDYDVNCFFFMCTGLATVNLHNWVRLVLHRDGLFPRIRHDLKPNSAPSSSTFVVWHFNKLISVSSRIYNAANNASTRTARVRTPWPCYRVEYRKVLVL